MIKGKTDLFFMSLWSMLLCRLCEPGLTVLRATSLAKKNCFKLHARLLHVTLPRATKFLFFKVAQEVESFSSLCNKFL